MASSFATVTVLDRPSLDLRVEQGLLIPMNLGAGLRLVDCGDDRPITKEHYEMRVEQFGLDPAPGRYYGASSGIAVAAMIGFAAEYGDAALSNFVRSFSAEGFVDFASNLSDRANRLPITVELNQHSDDTKEGGPIGLCDHKTSSDPLGCAFATKLGLVVAGANQPAQLEQSRIMTSEAGLVLPLEAAADGIAIVQRHLPEHFGIHRGALHHAQTRSSMHTPIAIHRGPHAPNEQVSLVMDLAGYRSNAYKHVEKGMPTYHHTPDLAPQLLEQIMPEINLDPTILRAAGVLLGESTRRALSGPNTPGAIRIEVIPPEFSVAA